MRGGARALVAGLVSFFAPLPHRSNSSEGRPTIDSMGVDEDEGLQMHETAVTAAGKLNMLFSYISPAQEANPNPIYLSGPIYLSIYLYIYSRL